MPNQDFATVNPRIFFSIVYCDQTIDEMKEELMDGCPLDDSDPDITAVNFPIKHDGVDDDVVEIQWLRLHKPNISTNDILDYMESQGFRPATLPEFLACFREYPRLKLGRRVGGMTRVCLGSSWVGRVTSEDDAYPDIIYEDEEVRLIPTICKVYSDEDSFEKVRFLGLDRFDRRWDASCRFAVVRKQIS